ncbi:MAG: class I SAM-dependent methyltransferase [Candidatus Omnitrophica bacterium]|nr:class I SAM-dependent methyltransferase [Candidatus Omnitrophota bacterium]
MSELIKCNLCGDDACEVIYSSTITDKEALVAGHLACTNAGHSSHHNIVRCKSCGLEYSNPRDSIELLSKFYREVKDDFYNIIVVSRKKAFERSFPQIEKLKKGNRLLDVGCYTGVFLEIARDKGYSVCGIEPSEWASGVGSRKGLDIKNYGIEDMGKIDSKFDIITMWDAIEHFSDPLGALELCFDKLNPAGVITITTMRCEGLFYFLCGRRWPWFMRMHLYYFTFDTLKKMLDKAGFNVVSVRPYTHYINLSYILYKVGLRFSSLLNNFILQRIMLPVQLGDFMEIYAAKKS